VGKTKVINAKLFRNVACQKLTKSADVSELFKKWHIFYWDMVYIVQIVQTRWQTVKNNLTKLLNKQQI